MAEACLHIINILPIPILIYYIGSVGSVFAYEHSKK